MSWIRNIDSRFAIREIKPSLELCLHKGILEKITGMWLNPVVIHRKKTKKKRLCTDFRQLNNQVEIDGYNIPNIQKIIYVLHVAEYLSVIDLSDGFLDKN